MNTHAKLCQQHGVMMKVKGTGVLIIGQPSIGKSSFAIELLHQGHQLIADDIVECQLEHKIINTHCPAILRGLLHSREIGVIDVEQQFGGSAVVNNCTLDVVVELHVDGDHQSHFEKNNDQYNILNQSRPLLRLNIVNPTSCYHRLLTWLDYQNLPDAAVKLIDRQQQALVNTHS